MNRIINPANLSQCFLLACLAGVATQSAADGVTKVPGKLNGYFYDVTSNQPPKGKEVSLVVTKQGTFKEYIIESVPEGLRCDEKCPETAQRVPAGGVTLKIIGKKPVSFLDIPLTGAWSEPCHNTYAETDICTFNLHDLNGRVEVEVNPNIEPGMIYPVPEGGEAIIVTVDTRDNYILLAAHENLSGVLDWLDFTPNRKYDLGIKNATDGRINSTDLLQLNPGSPAARHCNAMKNDWYLPAERELSLLTLDALKKVPNINLNSHLWSSTEVSLRPGSSNGIPWLDLQVKALSTQSASISTKYAYEYQFKEEEWVRNSRRSNRYQVLCFRRISF